MSARLRSVLRPDMRSGARHLNSHVDAEARRETSLAVKLKSRIQSEGAMSVEEYVHACLYDPEHGYYVSATAIGESSDFVTAPEISQVFGELIGIWAIMTWQQLGSPESINLIELGPGRGTMMADALRSIAKVPAFSKALNVHLVDTNIVLSDLQRKALSETGANVTHHGTLVALSEFLNASPVPSMVLANEFIDALGVRQQISHNGIWCERTVALDEDERLAFSVGQEIEPQELTSLPDATIRESNPAIEQSIKPFLIALAQNAPMAALFVDYGYTETVTEGETLQAMRAHAYEHPLTSPGEADLTAHVNFGDFAGRLATVGFTIDGPTTQGEFLGRLGIVERTSQLMANNVDKAAQLETATIRLLAPNGMGARFKAIGVRNWDGLSLVGLETVT